MRARFVYAYPAGLVLAALAYAAAGIISAEVGRWWHNRAVDRVPAAMLKRRPARPDGPTVMPRRAPYDWKTKGWM